MSLLQAIVLGLVQGVTEFVPVSSSAHLALFPWLLHWPDQGLAYDIALHWGTLAALIVFFRRDLKKIAVGVWGGAGNPERRFAFGLVIATIPGAAAGLIFDDAIETVFRKPEYIALSLMIFGVLLGAADRFGRKRLALEDIHWKICLGIGIAQALAIFPGVSRSGITLTAALFLGLRRVDSARFSFLLAIPIVLGAGILKLKDLDPGALNAPFFIGIAVSALSGYAAIRFFLGYLEKHGLWVFAVYRLALGGMILLSLLRAAQ